MLYSCGMGLRSHLVHGVSGWKPGRGYEVVCLFHLNRNACVTVCPISRLFT